MSKYITTNTTSAAGGDQQYGVGITEINAENYSRFGVQDIIPTNRSGEGVWAGYINGEDRFQTSRTIIKILDLVGEGPIEGLVSGEYVPAGNNPEGQLGWEQVNFTPYASSAPECWLRSIYLNETPVVNTNNQYNYQNLEASFFNGAPEGIRDGDPFLNVGSSNTLEKTRVINEKLHGPDVKPDSGGEGSGAADPFFYHSKVYRILNPHLTKVRVNIKVTGLSFLKQGDEWELDEIGDTVGSKVTFKYRYRPIYFDAAGLLDFNTSRDWYGSAGSAQPNEPISSQVQGLIRSAYIHKKEIEVADEFKNNQLAGWEIEVTRITLDSIQSNVINETYVDSITELYEESYSYPNSAMMSMNFNAEFFSQIPNRAFDCRLLKVKVPVGYDPITKQYSDTPWSGEFQKNDDGSYNLQWTDNPAWIFYDLISNKRYGLGKHFGLSYEENIDKWTLYEISKFCDILVPDGNGAVEPRFTCNTLINSKEDAYKVLADFASCFRAVTYYGLGSVHAIQDRPRPEVAQFTNANVENGDFYYTTASQAKRPTVCIVRYNDKTNFFKPALEYVEDTEGIRKLGVIEKEITAFACTSRSQAIRVARWILATEAAQSEAVNFTIGAEGMLLRPGDLLRISDENRADFRYGGRAISHSFHENNTQTSGILLDREIPLEENRSYSLFLTTPSYFYDTSLVSGLNSADASGIRKPHIQSFVFDMSSSEIEVNRFKIRDSITGDVYGTYISYAQLPSQGEWMFESSLKSGAIIDDATWTLIDNDYSSNLYTVIGSKEEELFKYKIEALVHEPRKYDYIESGVPYSFVPIPYNVTIAPPAPKGLELDTVPYDNDPNTHTKKITVKVKIPTDSEGKASVGTTIGYKIYIKEGDPFNSSDTITPTTTVPKRKYLDQTVYLTDQTDSTGNPITYYIPLRNNKTYYFRVFAVNGTSVMSNGYVNGNENVTDHFPVKDIKIHSMRLLSDKVGYNDPAQKTLYSNLDDKDFAVQWDVQFLNEISINIPIRYRVTIHEPSETSTPNGDPLENGIFITAETKFNYTFLLNTSTTGGPRRHVDIVVIAVDEDDIGSDGSPDSPFSLSDGWDILEVFNPKPTGYHLTPRKDGGKRPGDYICCPAQGSNPYQCERMTTEQYIDSDGLIVLKILNRDWPDLAGGYIYISKHPFSGNDFTTEGRPKPLVDRPNIVLPDYQEYKEADYEILEIPFEEEGYNTLPSMITVSPPAVEGQESDVWNYGSAYYMAVKFYDSFDREIKKITPPSDSEPSWHPEDAWIGFARDHEETRGEGNTLVGHYKFTDVSSGWYVGVYSYGEPSCLTGTFACPIWPTKYFAASAENGFKYWIRCNVNGQWEGNGISRVRALTHEDVRLLYNYQGYYEYSCYMSESVTGDSNEWILPNDPNSITRCRFRQGQTYGEGEIYTVDDPTITFGPWYPSYPSSASFFTTGATRPPDGIDPTRAHFAGPSFRKWQPLPRAGIPYGGWGRTYTGVHHSGPQPDGDWGTLGARPEVDKIDSYNWRGQKIKDKSRPLYGFRRFRVYFDPNNLPPQTVKDQLSSYAVIGMNSWNGSYESWPGSDPSDIASSILAARDEILAPEGAGTYPFSMESWIQKGDVFENIPGVWNHHPAGFGAGYGGLIKTEGYFDIHMGRMIDDSYLNEAFFGVTCTNDYSLLDSTVIPAPGFDQLTGLHESTWKTTRYITLAIDQGGDGPDPYPTPPPEE